MNIAFLSARSLEHLVELSCENCRSETRCQSKKYMNFSRQRKMPLDVLSYELYKKLGERGK